METLNLKTTLNAYPKLSPSILQDYVTKEDLTSTLENYVEEAPVDSKPYARRDETWVPVKESALSVERTIFYGSNSDLQLDNENEILSLQHKDTLPADAKSYIVNYNQLENGYMWIVCTEPISSIVWGATGMVAEYVQQEAVITSTTSDVHYYCYRITDILVPNQWVFLVNL